jgi:hypothetical protein
MRPVRHAHARSGLFALMVAAISLAGCAGFSPDAGMDVVRDIAAAELNRDAIKIDTAEKAAAAQARMRRLLSSPLSADAAVAIALLNNRGNAQRDFWLASADLGAALAGGGRAETGPEPSPAAVPSMASE